MVCTWAPTWFWTAFSLGDYFRLGWEFYYVASVYISRDARLPSLWLCNSFPGFSLRFPVLITYLLRIFFVCFSALQICLTTAFIAFLLYSSLPPRICAVLKQFVFWQLSLLFVLVFLWAFTPSILTSRLFTFHHCCPLVEKFARLSLLILLNHSLMLWVRCGDTC